MKLVFICGSFEQGHDGVGDYVRRLSAVLLKAGHTVRVIAFNDAYVPAAVREDQEAEGSRVAALRIPALMRSAGKRELASAFVQETNPDIVSLQYVPYSFHKKGMPISFWKDLKGLTDNRRFHILFHELWLDTPSGLNQKVTALIQRRLICGLVRKLKPAVVNVTVLFNQTRLRQVNIDAEVLGLFGNIYPVDEPGLNRIIFEDTLPVDSSVLYFGEPPKGIFRDIFLREMLRFCRENGQGIRIVLACGNSAAKDEFCKTLRRNLEGCHYEIIDCGFLPVGALSKLMLQCQAGISKSKPHLVAKSGAAVAMLEHGLPLWAPGWDGKAALPVEFRKQLIFSGLAKALESKRLLYHSLTEEVTKKFIDQLTDGIPLNISRCS